VETRVHHYRHELRHLASSDGLGLVPRRIAIRRERLDRGRATLYRMLESRARSMRRRLQACEEPLARVPALAARERQRLESLAAHLQAVSPLSILSRGYAIAFTRTRKRRKPILDSTSVKTGDQIEVQLKKGRLECTIDGTTLGLESLWPVLAVDGVDTPNRK
jgi:exodeoxyribonuclease VII large subunit